MINYSKSNKYSKAKQRFVEVYLRTNNASRAVRQAYPELTNPNTIKDKGYRLLTNAYIQQDIEKQKERMQVVASKALERIEKTIESGKEHNALSASFFAYEQAHGKARQRIVQSSSYVVVSYDLSGGSAPPIPQDVIDELDAPL